MELERGLTLGITAIDIGDFRLRVAGLAFLVLDRGGGVDNMGSDRTDVQAELFRLALQSLVALAALFNRALDRFQFVRLFLIVGDGGR